jgi:hypothetical protein
MKTKPLLNDDSDSGAVASTALCTDPSACAGAVLGLATSEPDVAPPRRAYDRNNLGPEDEEARRYDDTSEGIDWDEILESTEDDERAGRYAYNSADYATEEEAWAALDALIHSIFEEVLARVGNEIAARASSDSSRD